MAYVEKTIRIDEEQLEELENRRISLNNLVCDALDSFLEIDFKDKDKLKKEKVKAFEDIKDLENKRDLAVKRLVSEYKSELRTLELTRGDQIKDVKDDFNARIETIKFKIKKINEIVKESELKTAPESRIKRDQSKATILKNAYKVYVDNGCVINNNKLVKETILQASKDTGINYISIANKFYETAKKENKLL